MSSPPRRAEAELEICQCACSRAEMQGRIFMEDKGSVRDLYSKRIVERIVDLPCELSIPPADPSWSKDQCEIERHPESQIAVR